MNTGRPTTDPKGEIIRVRINVETRDKLRERAAQNDISISEVVRKAIKEYIRQL